MNQNSSYPPTDLIPACDRPKSVIAHTIGEQTFMGIRHMPGRTSRIEVKEEGQDTDTECYDGALGIDDVSRLAKGEMLIAPHGDLSCTLPGKLRMVWGYKGGRFSSILLEFLPDEALPQGMAFDPWFELRFPENSSLLAGLENEDWWILLLGIWAEETNPAPTLVPDDSLLMKAVINNHERLLEAILQRQPRIQVRPGSEKSLRETALGIAMENTGMFGVGPGFACGCHRNYRDDDFCQAEDVETWIPRAERVGERLKAAGAIDYSPMLAACRAGLTKEVEAMLKQGFPPNFSIYGHTTALCEAVQPGHEEVCDLLLCHGADPNQPRPFYTSMVFGGEIYPVSVATEHPAILKRLLEAGADPSIRRDDSEETPVVIVSDFETQENAEAIFSLVDIGSIRGMHGRSGVFYLNAKNLAFCRNIVPAEMLDANDELGMTPLLHAIHHYDFQKAILLLDLGADPHRKGLVWNEHTQDLQAPHFQRTTISDLLDWTHEQTPIPEYTGNANILPTMVVSPIQLALLRGSLELVERLHNLGTPAESSAIALYPFNEATKAARESIAKRIESEAGVGTRILADTTYVWKPEQREVADLAGQLATILLIYPHKAGRYPEMVGEIDLLAWAAYEMPNPALIEPFRSGSKLGKAGWIHLLDGALSELRDATQAFAEAINPQQAGETEGADTWDLLRHLRCAEQAFLTAADRITGKAIKPLNLAAEVCERASGDFKGGTARAYRNAETTGEVGFDDFAEALTENLSPGSTMDHGKLLHSVRLVTARLEKSCVKLGKSI